MAIKIKQGDQYPIPVSLFFNDEIINPEDISAVEFVIGGYRKLYPGEVTYDSDENVFIVPLTQEETFSWEADSSVEFDIRIKFTGGSVVGLPRLINISVIDASSEEVL